MNSLESGPSGEDDRALSRETTNVRPIMPKKPRRVGMASLVAGGLLSAFAHQAYAAVPEINEGAKTAVHENSVMSENPSDIDPACDGFPDHMTLTREEMHEYLVHGVQEAVVFQSSLNTQMDSLLDRASDLTGTPSPSLEVDSETFRDSFSGLAGPWTGRFNGEEYSHQWGEVVELDDPITVSAEGGASTVKILAYQYAWIGDGYGLNLHVERDGSSELVGFVTHLNEDGSLNYNTPHVGFINAHNHEIGWFTPHDFFFERVGNDGVYRIDGFVHSGNDHDLNRVHSGEYQRPSGDRAANLWEGDMSLGYDS